MKNIKYDDREISIVNNWDELSLGQFIEFSKLKIDKDDKKGTDDEMDDLLFSIRVFEILSNQPVGGLDDFPLNLLPELAEDLKFIQSPVNFPLLKSIEINGDLYAFKNITQLTFGEMVSFKTIQQNYPNVIDSLPYLLAIICRPAIKKIDEITGEEVFNLQKFDTINLGDRAKLFLNYKAIDLIGASNFFLSGNLNSTKNMQTFINQNIQKVMN